ncbi:hypothetical protein COV24_03345 [candidate division WWE3 bacterium CG10_big_fil_rev_8_21_14_0_10_32_10]|uniref:DUF4870 domain-containing protein n=1 Tax=candidate division WWE3 bacterium CG10_big_fil_rev_8_21_14_0_10_32_10 TaxID=1975090 RepID=A0A2H0R9Z1_UNCKA|nr:MAG: hypothetical protein COV24_03345 [candidate division WWE3 bacterium CG10_big_fil_rev_8_21_14_0_10_32_10]
MEKETSTSKVENEKVWAALAYIIFFLPLLVPAKSSKEVMYHVNQGFNLFLLAVAVNVIGTVLPIIGWFLVLPVGNIAVLVLAVLGIINALNNEKKELPLIGKYKIVKF